MGMNATAPLLPIPTDPEAAIRHLVRVIGPGFHPDNLASEYVKEDGAPLLSAEEASEVDLALVDALASLGDRAYQIAMNEMEAVQ